MREGKGVLRRLAHKRMEGKTGLLIFGVGGWLD
jgi:hypothetical protein